MSQKSLGQIFSEVVFFLKELQLTGGKKRHKTGLEQEAAQILQHIFKQNKAQLLMDFHTYPDSSKLLAIGKLLEKLKTGMPLAYATNIAQFGPLELFVDQRVLIPRIETEEWCEWILQKIQKKNQQTENLLDVCSGSGAIGLFFGKALEKSLVFGLDISTEALSVAKKNKKSLGITNVKFKKSDLMSALKPSESFDIIFSNPPYISEKNYNKCSRSVKDFEPKLALVAQENGLEFYYKILLQAKDFLTNKNGLGWLVLEYDKFTCQQVQTRALELNYQIIDKFTDSFGEPRAIILISRS